MNINFTLFAQAIVFAAFIGFTVKFIWPHLLSAIETRQKTIADGLAAAEQGKRALEMIQPMLGKEMGDTVMLALLGNAELRMGDFAKAETFGGAKGYLRRIAVIGPFGRADASYLHRPDAEAFVG